MCTKTCTLGYHSSKEPKLLVLMHLKGPAKAGLSKVPSCILCKTVTINQSIHFWLSVLPLQLTDMTNACLQFLVSVFIQQCSFDTLAQNLHEAPKSGEFLRHELSELTLRKVCWKSLCWARTVTSLIVTQNFSGCDVLGFSSDKAEASLP